MQPYLWFYYADTVMLIVAIVRAWEKMVEDIEISVKIGLMGLCVGSGGGNGTVAFVLRDRIEIPL